MKDVEVYSEKLGTNIKITEEDTSTASDIIIEDEESSLVGWTHNGWNNDNGGAGW